MSGYNHFLAAIIGAPLKHAGNLLAASMGMGGTAENGVFDAEASPNADAPATHFGFVAPVSDLFLTQLILADPMRDLPETASAIRSELMANADLVEQARMSMPETDPEQLAAIMAGLSFAVEAIDLQEPGQQRRMFQALCTSSGIQGVRVDLG